MKLRQLQFAADTSTKVTGTILLFLKLDKDVGECSFLLVERLLVNILPSMKFIDMNIRSILP